MKPKILFALHLPPPVHGAAVVGKSIHDSQLINQRFDCRYINLATARSLQDIGKGGVKKLWKFKKLLQNVRHTVNEWKPDLVYVTPNAAGGAFYKDFVVVEILKKMGCRVVVHYHNKGVRTRQDRKLDDALYRRFFKDLKVILLSDALYDDVRKYVSREDVWICPNGIPEITTSHIPEKSPQSVPHILFLSNLLIEKGVWVLLDALQLLKEQGKSFVCDFVGGETSEIDATLFAEEVERRGLNRQVIYHGRKYGEEKVAYFQQADLFVFPTYYSNECFPLVLLEAMSYSLPCIATDEGGIRDIVVNGENGFLVPKYDASALAQHIRQLIEDHNLCKEMGENGHVKFHKEFTLSAFENRMATCLQQCLTKK